MYGYGTYRFLHWIYFICIFGMTLSENIFLPSKFKLCEAGPAEMHTSSRFKDSRADKKLGDYMKSQELHVVYQHLNVPITEREISIDIIESTKVDIVIEESSNEDVVSFELQTYTLYSKDLHSDILMTHTTKSWDERLLLTLHVGEEQQTQASLYCFTLVLAGSIFIFIFLLSKGETIHHWKKKKRKSQVKLTITDRVPVRILTYRPHLSVDEGYMLEGTEQHPPLPRTNQQMDCNTDLHITSLDAGKLNEEDDLDICDREVGCKRQRSKDENFVEIQQLKQQGVPNELLKEITENEESSFPDKVDQSQLSETFCPLVLFNTLKMHGFRFFSTNQKLHFTGRSGKLPRPIVLCLCVTFSLAVVFAVHQGISSHHILKIFLPRSTVVRKIRSYSMEPDLSSVSINTSSLSLVTRLHLVDIEESCKANLTSCDTHAICETGFPSLKCRCKRGFFLHKNKCTACTVNAPEGYYMLEPCRAHRDVVFRPCTKCKGSKYMAAPCTTTQDTMCLDVLYPADHFRWKNVYLKKGNVSTSVTASDNVFTEKIGSMKDLDTAMYIANNQQSMQFTFPRKSGLEVKVRLSDIFLVPEYVDLDYIDDTPFLNENEYLAQTTKDRYYNLQNKFCRSPMPDHYKMILEIFANFTSAAHIVPCTTEGTKSPKCPQGLKEGGEYLERSYDMPCPQQPANFSALGQRPNNIFCSGNNDLLRKVFNVKSSDVTPMTFPTRECKRYHRQCQACFRRKVCNPRSGLAEDSCCSLSCYSEFSCQKSFSSACPDKPVTCANGDVYMFTIEPDFESLKEKFMCHLQYKLPKKLYKVDYFIHIPHLNFTSEPRTKVVRPINKAYHQRGYLTADYLSFYHDTASTIQDELVAIGSEFDAHNNPQKFKFRLLKKPNEFSKRGKFKVRPYRAGVEYRNNLYTTHVQFERPFLFSTSTWQDGGCLVKNVSQIHAQQPLYKGDDMDVSKPTIVNNKGQFEYQLTHYSIAPFIRFYLNGSESVFRHYRDDLSGSHIREGSLIAKATWNQGLSQWNLTINGSLSKVPAYLTMDVFDKFLATHLGYYDILVTGPSSFSITVHLHQSSVEMPDVFIVNMNDSSTCHRVIVSLIDSLVQLPSDKVTTSISLMSIDRFPWIPIIVTLCATVFILSGFLITALIVSQMKDENDRGFFARYPFFLLPREEDRFKPEMNNPVFGNSKSISRGVIVSLVVLYVLYALVFTFSMLLGVFYMIQGPLVGNLTIVSNTSAKVQEAVELHLQEMEDFETQQSLSLFNQTRDRIKSCSHHLKLNAENTFRDVYRSMEKEIHTLYSQNGTLHKLLIKTLEERAGGISAQLDEYFNESRHAIEDYFEPYLEKYSKFLKKVTEINWLNFPRYLFKSQEGIIENSITEHADIVEFMQWLEVKKVENVLDVKAYLINRLQTSLPVVQTHIALDKVLGVKRNSFGAWSSINTQVHQKHIVLPQNTYVAESSDNNHSNTWDDIEPSSTAFMMSQMKDILTPVFICVFIFTDILMLLYRFTWLRQMFKKAKLGAEEKIPTDSVAKKIHFTLTGHESTHPDDPLDNPYHYYMENKEDIWAGNNELYAKFCGASPKSKEDILREIWNHKKRQKRKPRTQEVQKTCFLKYPCLTVTRLFYKHLISPILWRFVLVGAFVLIICIIIKATNDLVTMETATFLMDTRSTLPQFHRQIDVTNTQLSDLLLFSNLFIERYESMIDIEVQLGNSILRSVIEQQNIAIQTVLEELCNNKNNTVCNQPIPQVLLPSTLTSCNFLPVTVEHIRDFNEQHFMDYLHSELLPLVMTLRQLLLNTCYILFAYACLMLICHTFIRVILLYLTKTSRLPKVFMFLVSNANECWKSHSGNVPKDMYRSNSWIESCESGVVGDIDDHMRADITS